MAIVHNLAYYHKIYGNFKDIESWKFVLKHDQVQAVFRNC